MAKDRSEEKKDKKSKQSLTEDAGVKKSKKDKKDKKSRKSDVSMVDADASEVGASLVADLEEDADGKMEVVTKEDVEVNGVNKEQLLAAMVPFANPMADEKAMKKVLKGVKRAAKHKTLKRGVKEVVKSLRKAPTSASSAPAIVVLAADISPFDVISHIPVLCEDHNVPYIYVPSRAELGAAGNTKRPTSVVMMTPTVGKGGEGEEEWKETWGDVLKVVEKAQKTVKK